MLKQAGERPVIITRHGRPRAAVISIRRYRFYEMLVAYYAEESALEGFASAIVAAAEGKPRKAAQACARGADLARFARKEKADETV